jgi:hypothetical protein
LEDAWEIIELASDTVYKRMPKGDSKAARYKIANKKDHFH